MRASRSPSRRTAVLLAAVLAGSAIPILSPASPAYADPSCQSGGAYMLWVRGSGVPIGATEAMQFQQHIQYALGAAGVGPYAWAELGNLDNSQPAGQFPDEPDEYPAVGVGWAQVNGDYNNSVSIGTNELVTHLNQRYGNGPGDRNCYNETAIIGGYSQGADVVGWALERNGGGGYVALSAAAKNHIGYAALYGDPKMDSFACPATSSWWVRGNPPCTSNGTLHRRVPYVRDEFVNRFGSWCDKDDVVCSNSLTGNGHTTAYNDLGRWIHQSAAEVVNTARLKVVELNPPRPDRTILHGPTGSLYVMAGGAKFAFPSWNEFVALGYSTTGMVEMSATALAAIPNLPRIGTVLRSGGGQLYTVAGGAKFQFGTMDEYYGLGYTNNAWINIPQGPLNAIGDAPGNMPVDGTVLRPPNETLYVVVGGAKFPFGSMTEYSSLWYSTSQIAKVPAAPTNGIPTASTATPPRNKTSLRGGGGQIYVVAGGAKFQFGSMAEYNALGYGSVLWRNVPQAPLDQIGDAPGNLPSNGTLLKGTGANIYLMQGGVRKTFQSMTQFTNLGYQTSNIVNVSDGPLLALPDGGNLS